MHLTYRPVVIALTSVLLLASNRLFAEPVARILEVDGQIKIVSPQGKERKAQQFGGLFADETVRLKAGNQIIVLWKDQRAERLTAKQDGEIKVQVDRLDPATDVQAIKYEKKPNAKTLAKAVSELPSLSRSGGIIPRAGNIAPVGPQLLPLHGSVVPTATPTFKWPAIEGSSYQFQLFEEEDADSILDLEVKTADYTVQKKTTLRPDVRYRWVVRATDKKGAPHQWEGEFEVADEKQQAAYAEFKHLETELLESKATPFLAVVANSYEQHKFFAEAGDVYARLVKLQPKSAAYWAGLGEYHRRAGQTEKAAECRETALKLGYEYHSEQSDNKE
jgi:tetratricopeptide (TPR) repeat protein